MQRRDQKPQFVLKQWHKHQLAPHRRRRLQHDGEVDVPAAQQLQLLPVVSRLDANNAFRITLPKLPQHRRENVLTSRRARPHAQSSVAPRGQRFQSGARGFHFPQNFFRVPQKLFPRLREHHPPADAIQ